MLTLQGLSELIKRVAALGGFYQVDTKYDRPVQ
jgi:TRAP-type mannitol/chloroaromatic compound transport system permease small subunit